MYCLHSPFQTSALSSFSLHHPHYEALNKCDASPISSLAAMKTSPLLPFIICSNLKLASLQPGPLILIKLRLIALQSKPLRDSDELNRKERESIKSLVPGLSHLCP